MAASGGRKSTGSNFGCGFSTFRFPLFTFSARTHSFSQSSSDGTVTSAYAKGVLPKSFWSRRSAAVSAAARSTTPKPLEFRAFIWQSWLLRVGHPRSVPFRQHTQDCGRTSRRVWSRHDAPPWNCAPMPAARGGVFASGRNRAWKPKKHRKHPRCQRKNEGGAKKDLQICGAGRKSRKRKRPALAVGMKPDGKYQLSAA
jgi:hypothetical protein